MKIKRSLMMVSSVAICAVLFAACGGGKDKEPTTTSAPPTATVANTPAPTSTPPGIASPTVAPTQTIPSSPVPATPTKPSDTPTGTPIAVNVILTDFRISSFTTNLTVGVQYTFMIQNNGAVVHSFVIEPVGATNQPLTSNTVSASVAQIAPGETATLTWTFDTAGTYQIASHNADDYAQGMVQANMVVTD